MVRVLPYVLAVSSVACSQRPHSAQQPPAGTQPVAKRAIGKPAIAKAPSATNPGTTRPNAQRVYGPLSTMGLSTKTPWDERKRAMRRNEARLLSRKDITEDLALLSRVIDLFFVPRTAEQRAGIQIRNQAEVTLRRLAPYSVASTCNSVMHTADRIDYCARPPGEMWPCDPAFKPPPPARPTQSPYEVRVLPSNIGRITIRDLSDGTLPAWAQFAGDMARVSNAAGILIDMRMAWGSDPRPLLPWLRSFTGRPRLTPLREIRRPPGLTPYVKAYRAKYLTEGRDPKVWATLVGPAVTHRQRNRKAIPVTVLVGRHCQSACELVTRVLATYANATVIGGVSRSGRLHRDEPALLTLPHSRIRVYFYATEYLLSKEIEAKTGPTSGWWLARRGESMDYDGTALALHEIKQRIAHPAGWPAPCSAHPAYRQVGSLPQGVRKKITAAFYLDDRNCRGAGRSVTIKANVSLDTMQRLVASCPDRKHVSLRSEGYFTFGAVVGIKLISRLAQSNVVEHITVRCTHRPQLQ